MPDIYDLSKSNVEQAVKRMREALGVPAIVAVVVDEHRQFVVSASSAVEGPGAGEIADAFQKGPPELLGYDEIRKVLAAAALTIDKCIREGSNNFTNMKP